MKKRSIILFFVTFSFPVFAECNDITFEGVIVEGECNTHSSQKSFSFSCYKSKGMSTKVVPVNVGTVNETESGTIEFSYINANKKVMMATIEYL